MTNDNQTMNTGKSVLIIGAGIAGLAAGCYARMNGYNVRILEMHNIPGGLCTAWNRKGYTIDGCMHWLVGSSQKSGFYKIWSELGAIQGKRFVEFDEFMRYETSDGKTVCFYADPKRLEEHLTLLFPADRGPIKKFCNAVSALSDVELPVDKAPETMGPLDAALMLAKIGPALPRIIKWGRVTLGDFCKKFSSPGLREAFSSIWLPETSMLFAVYTFAWLSNKTAAYPLGGSLPFAKAIEKRLVDLGGQIVYKNRVRKFAVSAGEIVGVETDDASMHHADWYVSAADAHGTFFDLLGNGFVTEQMKNLFSTPLFPPIIYAGVGVNMGFESFPRLAAGISMRLDIPMKIAGGSYDILPVMVENFDPSLAPPGKTVLKVMLGTDYDYWKALETDRPRYLEEKDRVAGEIVRALDSRFPGLAANVEMVNIATPHTFVRYTGNWRGSFEGFQMTPKNIFKPPSKSVPGISNLFLCGQWVEPGGGLPAVAMSGRNVVQILCKKDGVKFRTTVPD